MQTISKVTYDNFIINGEVNEQLPLYSDNLKFFYPLNGYSGSISPDLDIRAINNKISLTYGQDSLVSMSNISTFDNCLDLNGDSQIIIDPSFINHKNFELNIKFKVSDLSSMMNLLTLNANNENEMSLMIDNLFRCICVDTNKIMYTTPDINSYYSLTDCGAINKSIWYTLNLVKFGNIITVHINDMFTKSLVFKDGIDFDYASIGKNFKGLIEYVKITTYKDNFSLDQYTITDDLFIDDFTLGFYWNPDPVQRYNILDVGPINIFSNYNILSISLNNAQIQTASITEANTYYICIAYNKADRKMSICIYDCTNHKIILHTDKEITLTTNYINIKNDISIYDLAIYNACLKDKFILRNVSKKFSIDKNGNLSYNIDEEEIGFRMKDYLHFPLSEDLNSSCKTVMNESKVYISEQSVKSGIYEADEIINLFDLDVVDLIENELWDNNLHYKAYKIANWSTGYNPNVLEPNKGYHAKCVREHNSSETLLLKFINCNSEYNLLNRPMHMARYITPKQLWNKCNVGDKISIIFNAKSDIPCDIKIGFFRKSKSTGNYGFNDNLELIRIQNSSWNEFFYEIAIDEDWDLTSDANLYIYGNITDKATSYIKDIYLIKNGEKASISIIKDKEKRNIEIPFKDHFDISNIDFSILYNTKLISKNKDILNTLKDITWGIKNNKLYLKVLNKEISTAINEVSTSEWITYGLFIKSNEVIVYLGTRQGIYKCSINNTTLIASNIDNLILDNDNCSLYKDLFILKEDLNKDKFERYHRTKISYFNNSVILKNMLEESNL